VSDAECLRDENLGDLRRERHRALSFDIVSKFTSGPYSCRLTCKCMFVIRLPALVRLGSAT